MRSNAFWNGHRWLPTLLLALRMVLERLDGEASSLLVSRAVVGTGIRNFGFETLRDYARDSNRLHFPA